jgi:predicted RNA-binding protein with PUA-like domain
MHYWLFKSEPSAFSWADLERAPRGTTAWNGIRNYQARNYLRDDVAVGDLVLFYHSNADPLAVVGIAEVVRAGYPEDPADGTWYQVDIRAQEAFATPVTMAAMRAAPALAGMVLLKKGSRLSIQPVMPAEFRAVRALGRKRPRAARGV